jgi:putative ABC transport system ATP-binding protein
MKPMIEIHNLHKTYYANGTEVRALRGVEARIQSGEFVALMGPSGCGKSTLLHLLGGLDRPTEGDIFIASKQMNTLDETKRAILRRQTIGFVFQAYNLIPNLTVTDNIELPALLVGRSPKDASSHRQRLMNNLGISDKASAYPGELSGGEQQRVAIARALINRPAILLIDEPTGNLDSRSGNEVMKLLQNLHQEGQTILLATHDPKIAGYSERVLFMQDGTLVDEVKLTIPDGSKLVLSRLVELEL